MPHLGPPAALLPRRPPEDVPGPRPVAAAWADAAQAALCVTLDDGREIRVPALEDDPTFAQVTALALEIAPFRRWGAEAAARAAQVRAIKTEAARRIEDGPADWRVMRARERSEAGMEGWAATVADLCAEREAIRAAADALEATVAGLDWAEVEALDPTADEHWPDAGGGT